ncbi:DUF4126 domain-containing protein [Pseudomarimonas salicorniae]|uniref:DUF4126 domain-containing protein n=1 Tax=Pseudomarimonas salicorniae TaxID=2933270 RepID=A0ABT0GEC5_9GAMM|nr:DUF4126 domain-containing protein [Lysobacter sp. CAU 1642]MCK7592909.1 DUF4126 domain-containing protein [Lysobacter sp. CAU 1642]
MDTLTELSVAAALAWGSGLRLYAVVFLAGAVQRMGWVALPGDLALLAGDPFLIAAGVLLLGEFIADKVPAFDSLWDGLQTFARIPGGMALAWAALGEHGASAQLAAALLGGSIAGMTHLGKSGARAAINHSPEPFSNWTASFAEDGLVIFGLWLAWQHPWIFLILLALFLLVLAWLLPKLWRLLRATMRRLRQFLARQQDGAGARLG